MQRLRTVEAEPRADPQIARRNPRKETLETFLGEPEPLGADIRRRLRQVLADQWEIQP